MERRKSPAIGDGGASGYSLRPHPAIPSGVAPQQSPTPFHRACVSIANRCERERSASCGISGKDGFARTRLPEPPQDATNNYPQSCRVFQVIRLRKSQMGGRRRSADNRSEDRTSQERATDLLRLRAPRTRLRPTAGATLRVRAYVGYCGVLRVRDAAGRVSDLRREGGAGSLVRRQEPIDHDLSLVPCRLGQAALLERSRKCLSHELAERVSLGKTRGFLGTG